MARLTTQEQSPKTVNPEYLPHGTLVRLPWRNNEIAIVTFLGLISLSSDATWHNFGCPDVEVLPSGFKIELEQQ